MPTSSSSSRARVRAADLLIVRWSRMVSTSWVPMVNAGLRLVIGSWNAIAICSPRTSRSSLNDSDSRSRPSNTTDPLVMRPGGDATSRITASDETVLPEPDSPTSATTSPASTPKLTWSTTVAAPVSVRNSTDRSLTSSSRSVSGGGAWSVGRVTVVMPRRPLMRCLPFGSPRPSASRTPSPRVLNARMVTTNARLGTYTCHGCSLRYRRASWIMPPQLDVGRCTP